MQARVPNGHQLQPFTLMRPHAYPPAPDSDRPEVAALERDRAVSGGMAVYDTSRGREEEEAGLSTSYDSIEKPETTANTLRKLSGPRCFD